MRGRRDKNTGAQLAQRLETEYSTVLLYVVFGSRVSVVGPLGVDLLQASDGDGKPIANNVLDQY